MIIRFNGFLRANAARIAVALVAAGCIVALAAAVFNASKDYENARVLVQPIAVGQKVGWLSDYRPVTFGDCPTGAPSAAQPETTEPETAVQVSANPGLEPIIAEEERPVQQVSERVVYDESEEPEETEPPYEPEKEVPEDTYAEPEYSYSAVYSPSYFCRMGVIEWGGWTWTWYSERVLPGGGLHIPGRYTDELGYVRDGDGYLCLASSVLSRGTVVDTPFGSPGKVYDSGCASYILDVYVGW